VINFSQQVAALSAEKRALLASQLKKLGAEYNCFPLSFAQERLWFLDQMEPGNPVYNIPTALRLSGWLNTSALEQSLNELVRRHEALRTTLPSVGGRPVQVVAPALTLRPAVVDLRGLPPMEQSVEARRLTRREARRGFDLARGPLLRVTLLRLDEQEHVALFTIHHIVSDGWSTGVMVREVTRLYDAFCQGGRSPLPELRLQYADFATWQRQWLQGEVMETHLSYWKQQLAGAPPVLELPTDHPRPTVQTFRGARHSLALPPALSSSLKALSRREGVTLFMTLLAAFAVTLRYDADSDDIVVGTDVANRNREQTEGLIGFFINQLALRVDLSGNPTMRELLARVRDVALEAYAHQDLPFNQLVETLKPERDLSRHPLFQVKFLMPNVPWGKLELPRLTLSPFEIETETATFDVILNMHESGGEVTGVVEYSCDLFSPATITRLMTHFQTVLEIIVADPGRQLSELSLLSEPERHQLLREWNDAEKIWAYEPMGEKESGRPHTHTLTLPHLFEAQVERTPDAVAVVFEDEQVTYGELNRRADQLASYLRTLGVGPEVLVGICLNRSLEMIVSILGVLKAGGAYVPLDPTYPPERLALMLEDAQVPLLLTHTSLEGELPAQWSFVVCLDSDWDLMADERQASPTGEVIGDNLAYVIYTSGSTGMPKGVMIPHRALVNRTLSMIDAYGLDSSHRLLQFVSFSFDASAEEIFPTLTSGATLVLHPHPAGMPVAEFLLECERLAITTLHVPPPYFHQIVDQLSWWRRPVPEWVRLFMTGGESLSLEKLATWAQLCHHPSRFINAYGPTEATITATSYEVLMDPELISKLTRLPIGRPLANTTVYLLNRDRQPVSIGVPGELHIGDAGLARGYLNKPEATAEKFIPDPFVGIGNDAVPGALATGFQSAIGNRQSAIGNRLYRTGDMARYRPDGTVELLGRVDDQVKIRGFRIEPGEIEAVLAQHPAVQKSAVVARKNGTGDKQLVAYVVAGRQEPPPITELQRFLKERLPQFMLPSTFVMLAAMPLLPNGKVDRQALPPPGSTPWALEHTVTPPRTPVEEALAAMWAEVLGLEQVGIHNTFFDLGGHSLLVIQVVSRIRDVFKVEIPLQSFFEAPTVAELSSLIIASEAVPGQSEKIARVLKKIKTMSADDRRTAFQTMRKEKAAI
jgi:amino acid adenylation domain-containing protein